jgi:hypothetical protein
MWLLNRHSYIEKMNCAVNASWEADDYTIGFVLMTPQVVQLK